MVRTSDKLCWISTFELSMTRLPVARVCEGSDTDRNLVHLPLKSSRNQSAKSKIKVANLRAPPCTAVEPPRRSVYFRGLKRKSEITKAEIRKSLRWPRNLVSLTGACRTPRAFADCRWRHHASRSHAFPTLEKGLAPLRKIERRLYH